MSKIALLPIVAAAALGAGVSAAPADAAPAGGWDGGTACKVDGKPIPDCVPVFSPVFEVGYDDDATAVVTCPSDRPFPWAREGASGGWDTKYRVIRKQGFGLSDFDASVTRVTPGDGMLRHGGTVAVGVELEKMSVHVVVAAGCSTIART